MNLDRLDASARALAAPSRRRLLSAASAVSAVFAPLTLLSTAEARKHKHKRKHKKKNKPTITPCPDCPTCPSPPVPPPPPTCAGSCAENCRFCFVRPHASLICGEIYSQDTCGTASCASDADCVGVVGSGNTGATPYCVAQAIERATGDTFPLCTVAGQDTPLCARVDPCV